MLLPVWPNPLFSALAGALVSLYYIIRDRDGFEAERRSGPDVGPKPGVRIVRTLSERGCSSGQYVVFTSQQDINFKRRPPRRKCPGTLGFRALTPDGGLDRGNAHGHQGYNDKGRCAIPLGLGFSKAGLVN